MFLCLGTIRHRKAWQNIGRDHLLTMSCFDLDSLHLSSCSLSFLPGQHVRLSVSRLGSRWRVYNPTGAGTSYIFVIPMDEYKRNELEFANQALRDESSASLLLFHRRPK